MSDYDDVRELTELSYRYAFAIDDRDWAALRQVFTDEVEIDFGLGEENVFRTGDAFVAGSRAALERLDATQHIFSNHLFEVDGDRATGRFYMYAQHLKSGAEGGALHTLGGQYHDEYVRADDGWKVRRRVFRAIWGWGNNGFNPGFRSDAPV